MKTFVVINKATDAEEYRYTAEQPIEWVGFEFATHEHIELAEPTTDVEQTPTAALDSKIAVGAFFDRFGQNKLGILSSADPLVQALIKDASVRKHIDLAARKEELLGAMALLRAKGFDVSDAVITAPVTDEERV